MKQRTSVLPQKQMKKVLGRWKKFVWRGHFVLSWPHGTKVYTSPSALIPNTTHTMLIDVASLAICFKYHIVMEWKSRFSLGLDADKNTNCMRKLLKLKLLSIEFCTQKSAGAHVYIPHTRVELGVSKDWYVSNIILYLNEKLDSL